MINNVALSSIWIKALCFINRVHKKGHSKSRVAFLIDAHERLINAQVSRRLTHGYEFFRTSWMNSNGIIKVSFGRAHLNSNRKTLNHFIHTKTNTM